MAAAVVVAKSEYPQLLSCLREFWPESFKLCGDLQSCIKRGWGGTEFVVDKWPHPTAVIERPKSLCSCSAAEKFERECREYFENIVFGVFGETEEALTGLLKTPGIIAWKRSLIFCCVPEKQWPMLHKAADAAGGKMSENPAWILKATPEDTKPLPTPKGMKLVSCTEDTIDIIQSTWKFAGKHTIPYIRALIQHFPSLALITESGQHVGHMLGQAFGGMGMLHVLPEFRGRGYAKVIITNLAQKYFDIGGDTYVAIERSNSLSRKLHESVGFRVLSECVVSWSYYSPGGSVEQDIEEKCCV